MHKDIMRVIGKILYCISFLPFCTNALDEKPETFLENTVNQPNKAILVKKTTNSIKKAKKIVTFDVNTTFKERIKKYESPKSYENDDEEWNSILDKIEENIKNEKILKHASLLKKKSEFRPRRQRNYIEIKTRHFLRVFY